jgi:predicted nucleic acid-binding protein
MGPSSLIDPSIIVVADTSTAINLNATGCAAQILGALPNRLHMTDIAIAELDIDKRNGRQDGKLIAELITRGLVVTTPLGSTALGHFESLVIGRGKDTLDDGEASTMALSLELNGAAIIDERKAKRICGERFPRLAVGCTMDILSHDAVLASLGRQDQGNAVYQALQDARMRIPPHYMDWVIDLIGRERAAACPSLPRSSRHEA